MVSPFPYSAIIAKCRAMSAKMLKYDDYAVLAASPGLSDAAAYLSSHGLYSDELGGVSLAYINRSRLEELFAHGFDRVCGELLTFAGGNLGSVIGTVTKKREISGIIDRAFLCRSESAAAGAECIEDFLNSVRGTAYFGIVSSCVTDGKIDCTRLESSLYSHYFESLAEAAENADSDVAEMIDTLIDYRSIDVILRARKNFGMSAEAIYPYLPPNAANGKKSCGGRFSREELMKFCSLGDDELQARLERRFGSDFSGKNYLDANYRNMFLYKYYRKAFASTKSSFGVPFAFIGLCETELTNLVHIIEGLRYSLPPEQILECVSATQEVRS